MQDQGMIGSLQQPVSHRTTSHDDLLQWRSGALAMRSVFIFATLLPFITGCQSTWQKQRQVVHRDPVLSLTMSRNDLVDHLNQQNQGLNGWRSMSTKLYAKIPGAPNQSINGYIACQSPNYFRLKAHNFAVKADLGSNADHCWVYLKPIRTEVLKWKHEDTPLLQQVPSGIPSIDPNWLLLVLGITPLDANDYQLEPASGGKPELSLIAHEKGAGGQSLHRIIKVDTLQGVIREHAVYDGAYNTLVRAVLSRHQRRDGHLIPASVKLSFPQTKTELALNFDGIETNPYLPDEYWHMPDKNVKVVDLGDALRHEMRAHMGAHSYGKAVPRVTLQPPVFHRLDQTPDRTAMAQPGHNPFSNVSSPVTRPPAELEEPDWSTPTSSSAPAAQRVSFEEEMPKAPAKRRGLFLPLLFRR